MCFVSLKIISLKILSTFPWNMIQLNKCSSFFCKALTLILIGIYNFQWDWYLILSPYLSKCKVSNLLYADDGAIMSRSIVSLQKVINFGYNYNHEGLSINVAKYKDLGRNLKMGHNRSVNWHQGIHSEASLTWKTYLDLARNIALRIGMEIVKYFFLNGRYQYVCPLQLKGI